MFAIKWGVNWLLYSKNGRNIYVVLMNCPEFVSIQWYNYLFQNITQQHNNNRKSILDIDKPSGVIIYV